MNKRTFWRTDVARHMQAMDVFKQVALRSRSQAFNLRSGAQAGLCVSHERVCDFSCVSTNWKLTPKNDNGCTCLAL